MSNHNRSHDGLANGPSLSDKNALLDIAANCDQFADDGLVEFARLAGPEAMDKLCDLLGNEKIHIPKATNFWNKLNRTVNRESMVQAVSDLIETQGLTMRMAVNQVAQKFSVRADTLRQIYIGQCNG